MPENGGELAGFLGEMMKGSLEAMASQRERRGEGRPAGLEALGQIAAQRVQEMPEYFKIGAPYGRTNEGMQRWLGEKAAAATAAAAQRLAAMVSPPAQAISQAQENLCGQRANTQLCRRGPHTQLRGGRADTELCRVVTGRAFPFGTPLLAALLTSQATHAILLSAIMLFGASEHAPCT